jgi:hypothetical protein
LPIADIFETKGEPIAHVVMHRIRDKHATWLGKAFKARRDVHAISEDVLAFCNHVAEVNTDAEFHALIGRNSSVALGHPPLHPNGATHRVDHAGEFGQEAIAGVLHDPAVVSGDRWIDQLPEMRPEPFVRALLIRRHQARIARHIGGEDRDEAAGGGHPGSRNSPVPQD